MIIVVEKSGFQRSTINGTLLESVPPGNRPSILGSSPLKAP
jgi:hypothetical protein